MDNRCVCCGEIIPEGRMICPNCERGTKRGTFESRKPNECPHCMDVLGIHFCVTNQAPCVRVRKCPEGRDGVADD